MATKGNTGKEGAKAPSKKSGNGSKSTATSKDGTRSGGSKAGSGSAAKKNDR